MPTKFHYQVDYSIQKTLPRADLELLLTIAVQRSRFSELYSGNLSSIALLTIGDGLPIEHQVRLPQTYLASSHESVGNSFAFPA
jgi:hypothetical protein